MVKEGSVRKVWKWGYKMHLLVDTAWELPIACEMTLARESDVTHLIPLLDKAGRTKNILIASNMLAIATTTRNTLDAPTATVRR